MERLSITVDPKTKFSTSHTDGEAFIIENEALEYKKYFSNGNEVDWDAFTRNRPEDILEFEEVNKLKDKINQGLDEKV